MVDWFSDGPLRYGQSTFLLLSLCLQLASSDGCFTPDMQYSPVDMLGQQRTVHKTEAACQRRCASVLGCVHFSYQVDTGGCHLEDKDAQPQQELGIISGPAHCVPAPVLAVPTPVPARPDVWHNPMLVPGLIAAGGVAAAGGIAGIAVAAAQAAHRHDKARPHPTFPPVGPTTTSQRQKSFAAKAARSPTFVAAASNNGLRARKVDDSGSAQSGIWIFLLAFAAAVSAIGLAIAAWYFLCRRVKGRAGNTYFQLSRDGDDDEDEEEKMQQHQHPQQRHQEGLDVEAVRQLYMGSLPQHPMEYLHAAPAQSFYAGQALQQQPIHGNDPSHYFVPHNPYSDTQFLRT